MEIQDENEHEHARLVLMEQAGSPSFSAFVADMREEWPEIGLIRLKQIYSAYRGWDGRERPFLDVETGKRL